MIPHIVYSPGVSSLRGQLAFLREFAFLLSLGYPAFDVSLLARADGERVGGHVFTDGSAAPDVRVATDRDRRDELRVAAHECAVLDGRRPLLLAVVVARDGAGAHV